MKLNEALSAVARARDWPTRHHLFVACGFELLYLPAFLQAHYQTQFPGNRLVVGGGLYGDLPGNLARAAAAEATATAVILQWGDLDPRLGLRSTGPWSGAAEREVRADVAGRLGLLGDAIGALAERTPVVLVPPTIPFSLAGSTSGWQMSGFELDLEHQLAGFLAAVAAAPSVRVVHPQRLAADSPPAARHDPQTELGAGFPFRVPHADAVARAVVQLAFPPQPKKGIITDLDDTLWAGIVGEVGPAAVAWGQADNAQLHGLYQSVLRQLSGAGALLGIATKNDPQVVEVALGRPDLIVGKEAFFPVYAGWGPKSEAVSAILAAWNVGADSVVFVDDTRMELEEVKSVHPTITCLELPAGNPARALEALETLRDLFGKPVVVREDSLRHASVRAMAAFRTELASRPTSTFIRELGGRVRFEVMGAAVSPRLLELINKTNQFNLNGTRLTEGEWGKLIRSPGSFVAGVSYRDRYGDLGTIGVIAGIATGDGLEVQHWVLSCRAFSRQIEDHMLDQAFAHTAGQVVRLHYKKTERNGPLREFLQRLGIEPVADGPLALGPQIPALLAQRLPHEVQRG